MHDARFLTGDDHPAAVGEREQDWRGREIEIGPVGLGAVGLVRQTARRGVSVLLCHLLRPQNFPGVHIERHKRIAGRRRRIAVVVAGRHIKPIQLGVDGRRRPHRHTRRSPELSPHRVLLLRLRLFDGVGLPQDLAVRRIDRDNAAAEFAAFVCGVGARRFLAGCGAHIDASVIERRRASDAADGEVVNVCLPQQPASCGVERVEVGLRVAEDRDVAIAHASDADGRAHALSGIEEPVDAAGRGVERVDLATPATDEHASPGDRGLRVRLQVAGERERPLQFQLRHISRGETRVRRVLKSRVARILSPSGPARTCIGIESVCRAGPFGPARSVTHRRGWRRGDKRTPERLTGQEFGDRATLGGGAVVGHGDHRSRFHGREHAFGGQRFERVAIRCAVSAVVVALRAVAFIELGAVRWRRLSVSNCGKGHRNEDEAESESHGPGL